MLRKNSKLLVLLFTLNCLGGALADKGGAIINMGHSPSATVIRSEDYKTLGESEGESSAYYLLGLIPVTPPLNIDYAMSQAVQKIPNGSSMVNVRTWIESHYYFPVGKVLVLKVKGQVVDLKQTLPLFEDSKSKKGTKRD